VTRITPWNMGEERNEEEEEEEEVEERLRHSLCKSMMSVYNIPGYGHVAR
jgi:hypothetical protein